MRVTIRKWGRGLGCAREPGALTRGRSHGTSCAKEPNMTEAGRSSAAGRCPWMWAACSWWWRARRRAVHDQYRHRDVGRRHRQVRRWRPRARRSAHHRRPQRGGSRRARASRTAAQDGWSVCRSSATFTTSATSSWPNIQPAPKRSTSIASIPAMWLQGEEDPAVRAIVETAIKHGKPVASAPIGARSTRSC